MVCLYFGPVPYTVIDEDDPAGLTDQDHNQIASSGKDTFTLAGNDALEEKVMENSGGEGERERERER